MKQPEEEPKLDLRERPLETISLSIPLDTLDSLMKLAAERDMSVEALLKLYIGQGLRQDMSQRYAHRVLETTAEVLTRHVQSKDEVAAILQEIRNRAA